MHETLGTTITAYDFKTLCDYCMDSEFWCKNNKIEEVSYELTYSNLSER